MARRRYLEVQIAHLRSRLWGRGGGGAGGGGGSVVQIICQNPQEVKFSFLGKFLRGYTILGFIAFLLKSFSKNCFGEGSYVTPLSPSTTCVHLLIEARHQTHSSCMRGRGFKLKPMEAIFNLDQKHGIGMESCGKKTRHCCMCFYPANRRVEFEDGWLIKSSFISKDEIKGCELPRTKIQQKIFF